MGYFFSARNGRDMSVTIEDQVHTWEVLGVLEFDSDRKRMSVIVRNLKTNGVELFCKG
jgi:magnesium-transporting ATPase (P-type)